MNLKTIKISPAAHTGIKLLAIAENRNLSEVASEVILTFCSRSPVIKDLIEQAHGEFDQLLCMDNRERLLAELEKPPETLPDPRESEPHPWFESGTTAEFQEAVQAATTPILVKMLRNIDSYSSYRASYIQTQYEKRTGKAAPTVDDKET